MPKPYWYDFAKQLYDAGYSTRKIAGMIGISHQTVWAWVYDKGREYFKDRHTSLIDEGEKGDKIRLRNAARMRVYNERLRQRKKNDRTED